MPSTGTTAHNAYVACVKGGATSLNEVLSSFNQALDAANIKAVYTQRDEEYAEWLAESQEEQRLAREFYNQLMGCQSEQEVLDLIILFRDHKDKETSQ